MPLETHRSRKDNAPPWLCGSSWRAGVVITLMALDQFASEQPN